MDIVVSQNKSRPLVGPIKAQFIDVKTGKLWRFTPGLFVDESEVSLSQSDTLSANVAKLAKSCTFRVPIPEGMAISTNPRFVLLHLFDNGDTDAPSMGMFVDLSTGFVFDPFYTSIKLDSGDVLAQKG